jgi:hypothetical protein
VPRQPRVERRENETNIECSCRHTLLCKLPSAERVTLEINVSITQLPTRRRLVRYYRSQVEQKRKSDSRLFAPLTPREMTLSFAILRKVCPITVNRPRVHVELSKNSASSFKFRSKAKKLLFSCKINSRFNFFMLNFSKKTTIILKGKQMFVELGWSYAMLVHR